MQSYSYPTNYDALYSVFYMSYITDPNNINVINGINYNTEKTDYYQGFINNSTLYFFYIIRGSEIKNIIFPLKQVHLRNNAITDKIIIGNYTEGRSKTITVKYSSAFSSDIEIGVITTIMNTNDNELFIVNLNNITNTGFIAIITRIDSDINGWNSSIQLHYLAYPKKSEYITITYYSHLVVTSNSIKFTLSNNQQVIRIDNIPRAYNIIGQITSDSNKDVILVNVGERDDNGMNIYVNNIIPSSGGNKIFIFNYIIIPVDTPKTYISSQLEKYIVKGDVEQELHIKYKDGYITTYRVYMNDCDEFNDIELIHKLNPIAENTELISQFMTSINEDNITIDLNGLDYTTMTFNKDVSEYISGNYHPASILILSDDNISLGMINDRPHGVANIGFGQIEIMLQRDCIDDDGYGLNEVLKENAEITTYTKIILNKKDVVYNKLQ